MRRLLPLYLVIPLLPGCSGPELSPRCVSDEDCPADQLCNFVTAACYPGTRLPALSSAAAGSFSCPYFAQEPTKVDDLGRTALQLEYGGRYYTMRFGCGIWPKSSYLEMVLLGGAHDGADGARFSLLLHQEDYRPGTLQSPRQLWGWLFTQSLNGPLTDRALAWGGTLTLSTVTSEAGKDVEGRMDLKLVPLAPRPFSALCRLKQPCAKGCTLQALALASPDCVTQGYCQPLYDGSARGFCTRHCTTVADCMTHDPGSDCISGNPNDFCLHTCGSGVDCESPLVCNGQVNACYPQ